MHILRCMGSKFCGKFQRVPLKFHTNFGTHIPQNMHFIDFNVCVLLMISLNCDVISLSETGPRSSNELQRLDFKSLQLIWRSGPIDFIYGGEIFKRFAVTWWWTPMAEFIIYIYNTNNLSDGVTPQKCFPNYWPFARGIPLSPVDFLQLCGSLRFFAVTDWICY